MKVWVVLPAFNEADNLPPLFEGIGHALGSRAYETVVVDDGSRDGTASVVRSWAQRFPIRLVSHVQNRGLARAIETGIQTVLAAAQLDDIMVTMDADNTHPPGLIPTMLETIQHGADVVIASRFVPGGAERGVPWIRLIMSHGIGMLMRCRFGLKGVRDYSCGYRAYLVRRFRQASDRYGNRLIESRGFTVMAELLVKLAPFCHSIVEVPLQLQYDNKRGVSKMRILPTILGYLRLLLTRSQRAE